ncbi:cellulose binding domain-containing protein [Plantactinospora sp. DSM 117369]
MVGRELVGQLHVPFSDDHLVAAHTTAQPQASPMPEVPPVIGTVLSMVLIERCLLQVSGTGHDQGRISGGAFASVEVAYVRVDERRWRAHDPGSTASRPRDGQPATSACDQRDSCTKNIGSVFILFVPCDLASPAGPHTTQCVASHEGDTNVRSRSLTPTSRRRAGLRALLILGLVAGGSLVTTGAVGTLAAPASAATVNCDGDGVSGKRVQMLYVRGDATPDDLPNLRSTLLDIPARIDEQFLEAARRTGGPDAYRAVRWVTDANCLPTITSVVVPQSIMGNLFGVLDSLRANGYNSVDRKYAIWYEGTGCGDAWGREDDDSPGPSNLHNNNTNLYGHAFVGLRNAGCFSWSTMAHELLHTLGAVQSSAPHATATSHCWDQYDMMCYDDEDPLTVPVDTCLGGVPHQIDCNGDDYFNVSPPAGSYLDTHWNIANSAFLIKTAPPAPSCTVAYTKSDWGNNFNADLTITNTSGPALSTWQLTFSFPGTQQINSSWPGSFTQTGQNVTLNAGTPGFLGVGASVQTFFNANYSGTNADPTAFRLNGQLCTTT